MRCRVASGAGAVVQLDLAAGDDEQRNGRAGIVRRVLHHGLQLVDGALVVLVVAWRLLPR